MRPIFSSPNLVRRDGQGNSTLQFGVIIAMLMPKFPQGYTFVSVQGTDLREVMEPHGDLACLKSRVQMEKRKEVGLERPSKGLGVMGTVYYLRDPRL